MVGALEQQNTLANMRAEIDAALAEMPIVAILRGLTLAESETVVDALIDAGITLIEVPLNSPDPITTIGHLVTYTKGRALIGAGTVLSAMAAQQVADVGGVFCVMPNCDPAVISATLSLNMVPMPGVLTPTEAFAAHAAGADILKLFPASSMGVGHVKALLDVLPKNVRLLAVGGVGAHNAVEWFHAGVSGLGVGGEIYRTGRSAEEISARAIALTAVVEHAKQKP